jgi:hypothetical protein
VSYAGTSRKSRLAVPPAVVAVVLVAPGSGWVDNVVSRP